MRKQSQKSIGKEATHPNQAGMGVGATRTVCFNGRTINQDEARRWLCQQLAKTVLTRLREPNEKQ